MIESAAKKPRRLGLIIPWVVFALIAAGWTGYWFILRAQTIAAVEAGIVRERVKGAKISHGAVGVSGYPLRLTVRYASPSYEAPGGGWAVSAPSLDLHINPSNLNLIILEPRGPIAWRNRDVSRTLSPRTMAISVRTKSGAFEEIRASADDLTVTRAGGQPGAMKNAIIAFRPDPRRAGDMQMSLDITDLALAAPPRGLEGLGPGIKSLSARVVFEQALIGDTEAPDRVETWRTAGGAARAESLGLLWGPAKITGAGRVALDAERKPLGRLDLALETQGAPSAMDPMLQGVFAAAAQVSRATGKPTPISVRFEEGVMKLGDLPIRPMEPIK